MEEAISFHTEGDAGPYLIVPPESYESLHEFLNKQKITRSAGDRRGSHVIIEVPAYSTELETTIDSWFVQEEIAVEKEKEGGQPPSSIRWSYRVEN